MCTGAHPFIPVANTVKMTAVFNANGEVCETVQHVRCHAAPTPAALVDIAGLYRGWWHDQGRTHVTSACELTELRLVDLSEPDGIAYDIGFTGEGGTATGEATPNNLAYCVKWGTGFAGASNRGRTYGMGLPSLAWLQNRLVDATRSALQTTYAALLADINAGAYNLAIVSLCHNKVWRTTGVVHDIVSLGVDGVAATQQRRLPGK